jgi:predicted nicotinamide N-methyase
LRYFAAMELKTTLQTFRFGEYQFNAFVPEPLALQQTFAKQVETDRLAPAPYWAQVWAAAYALCHFLATEPEYIKDKKLMELAAGLGLPSFLAAQIAGSVICSDISTEAVAIMERSIDQNEYRNCKAMVVDWNNLPTDLSADVILLSDINYEPKEFESLYKVIHQFILKGCTIILSTPQRLMAKPFIERLEKFIIHRITVTITELQPATDCSVFVLKV